jgi:glc operon protein GlcG
VTAAALQQRHAQLTLQPPDLLAERRLCDVQPLRGAAEVELLSRGDEVFNEAKVEPVDRYSLLMRRQLVLDFGLLGPHSSFANERSCKRRPGGRLMSAESAMSAMRPTLSGQASRQMIDAAVREANATSVPVTIVVVDESGVTKEMLRMDQAPLVSVQTAINKAYAAAAIGMPPDDFYAAIESDGAAVAEFGTRSGLALIAGGLPVVVDGHVAGAIGVAGAMTGADDRRIAEVAIAKATS